MNILPSCVLFTQDEKLARRTQGYLRFLGKVHHVANGDRLDAVMHQSNPTVLIFDLTVPEGPSLLEYMIKRWPQSLVIVLGVPLSEPLLEVQRMGVYVAEDIELDRRRFQPMFERAVERLRLMQENQMLREEMTKAVKPQFYPPLPRPERSGTAFPLRHLSRAFRHFGNLEGLLANIVEDVAHSAMVSRVGIFTWSGTDGIYKLLAGLKCLPESHMLTYTARDPFVGWLEMNAHLVSRSAIEHTQNPDQRLMLQRALDSHGAEVIIPLHAQERIIGWLFVGHRVTGLPFEYGDLEGLMTVAEYISTTLENALLYEESAAQKTLTETLLNFMPTGIIATNVDGIVRCINSAAEKLLDVRADEILNQPMGVMDSRINGLLKGALDGKDGLPNRQEWIDPLSNRSITAHTRRLMSGGACLGAVVLVDDLTTERIMREKQERLERASMIADLAATMSHEIRNPLVSIKTFAQLLPERKDDVEFLEDFNKLVLKEIDRLIGMVEQMHEIAHPPELVSMPINLKSVIDHAVCEVRKQLDPNVSKIETFINEPMPEFCGDEKALMQCMIHLLRNSIEAKSENRRLQIAIDTKTIGRGGELDGVVITVQDNGAGIPDDIKERIFSPFCTTKHSSFGLGLPMVKQTVVDHHGTVEIRSGEEGQGTCVTITIMKQGSGNDNGETHSDS